MADESELARFRQQWKAEVTARSHLSPSTSSSTVLPQARPKRPSFSQARPPFSRSAETDDLPADAFFNDEPPSSPPPPNARRLSISGIPRSALDHYEKAVEKEAEGNLGESLKLYRKAFRMDDAVDKSYKDKHFPRAGPSTNAAPAGPTVVQSPSTKTSAVSQKPSPAAHPGVSSLVESFSGLRIEAISQPSLSEDETEGVKSFSLLAGVPSEILLQILRILALSDVATFVRLAQVCKSLSYVIATEEQIWRATCQKAYERMIWDWAVTVTGQPVIDEPLGEPPAGLAPLGLITEELELGGSEDVNVRRVPLDEEELPQYQNSWRLMYQLRPRVRFNGIYISTCNYHRPGGHSGTSLSWGTPVHIVTYYRYLRFYPDGTVLSLLSTHEPSEVVYNFSKASLTPAHLGGLPAGGSALSSWGKHVSSGRWRMDPEGRVDVEVEVPGMDRYLFVLRLRIRNVRGGGTVKGGGKLLWEGFWSWNKLTDDWGLFEGRNDKPFFFSRVGQVEKELGTLNR